MRRLIPIVALVAMSLPASAFAQKTLVLADGTRMEVKSYEIKENLVTFTTADGKLRSMPRSYIDLAATEAANGGGGAGEARPAPPAPAPAPAPPAPPRPSPAPASPTPAPEPPPMPTETIQPEPPVAPVASSPPEPAPAPDLAPPPVWSNDELHVSLVVPSRAWNIDDLPPSFDVAVALTKASSEARATLALIRQKLRSRKEFQEVVADVRRSVSQASGFRMIEDEPLELDPYTAHEFRFEKSSGAVDSYNRLIVVYSRDLAYVLSLTCPVAQREANEADFDALVRGLVVKKPRQELAF